MESDFASIEDLTLTPEQRKAVGFLAEFTKRMVVFAFQRPKTLTKSLNLIKEVYRVTDDMMVGCFKNGTKPPCRKGCFWCCFLRVKVTPLEVLCIADYLRSHLETAEISELRQRLASTDETTRGMDGHQRHSSKMVCPLLVDGKCLAYPVRPIACRVYHSLDLSDCHTAHHKEGSRMRVRQDISKLSMGLFAGLTEGLHTVRLQTPLLELIAGLRIVMDESGSGRVKSWLSGEPVFVEAEITGVKNIDGFHRALLDELGEPLY
jgi:hypothetical protein